MMGNSADVRPLGDTQAQASRKKKGSEMSIFGDIMGKIFHAATSAVEGAIPSPAAGAAGQATPTASPAPTQAVSAPSSASPSGASPVDVEAVLTRMATQKGGGGNWQTSIVDLLKLLDLNSSLSARKQLAGELDTHIGADGTAEENVALHKAVMQKLAENGGKVPASMMGQ